MNKMSPNRKRFWVASWVVLSLVCIVALGGLYKFYRAAVQIYDPAPKENTRAANEAPLDASSQSYLHYLQGKADTRPQTASIEETQKPANKRVEQKSLFPNLLPARLQELPNKQSKKVETFLLLGVDSRRKGDRARADTIMLVTVPELGGDVHMLSIPRDTHVQVEGHGYTKINHAMSYGGVPLLKRTVQNFLGVPVDHTVLVDFDGFRKVVDQIGGLELKAEKAMDYDDPSDGTSIHLQAGQKLATGKLALDYARFRHDVEADTGRMRRQQQVIRAMIQQGGKPDNWGRMFKLAEIAGEHVKTDVPPREWVRLVMSYAYNKPEQIQTLKIEGVNRISDSDHLWYFFVTDQERRRLRSVLEQLRRGNA
ncbi:hypothetical protein CIG75_02180 [Tumebacillus algifaecis]|uniref:Cell envelope-related transcriptional attenuator domain-containing protein n=1 Tax=Tumebacillus algifaecis TaxID=1214604 RepID=A0A223CX67_9BACL|nr:LCP family protein [Tumebacillus algifaecis]ASS73898.1 hypothetical protein CIG75_02180 [Tumebacillus algifaecis]